MQLHSMAPDAQVPGGVVDTAEAPCTSHGVVTSPGGCIAAVLRRTAHAADQTLLCALLERTLYEGRAILMAPFLPRNYLLAYQDGGQI